MARIPLRPFWAWTLALSSLPGIYGVTGGPPIPVKLASPPYHPNRLLVKPKAVSTLGAAVSLSRFHGQQRVQVLRQFPAVGGLQVLELSTGSDVRQAAESYRQSGLVEYAEPDYELTVTEAPNDPEYVKGRLWGLRNPAPPHGLTRSDIHAPEGWRIRSCAPEIIVAVIDTGIRYTHEDLAENMWTNSGEIPANGIDDDHDGYVDDVYGINAFGKTRAHG